MLTNTAVKEAQKELILVVEDDVHLLEGVRTVLELDGYEVLTAENGRQALEVLRKAPTLPNLIVSDIMMPMMTGIELLIAVRQEPTWITIPFIFLTARSEKSDVQKGKQLGVDDYLIKPFDAEDLLITVDARLQRARALRDAQAGAISDVKRRILTILNHEFRTPLTFVVAYADMLTNAESFTLSNEEILAFLKGVNTGAVRLRRLIENFIHLVEMETGDARRTFDMRKAPIEDVASMLQDAMRTVFTDDVQHTCALYIQPNLPSFIGDVAFLKIALVQLLDNAVKFSDPNAPITLGAHAEGDSVYLWVKDKGRGIEKGEQGNIWESFYQVNRVKFEDQGAGSGLAIVRGVVDLHGGQTLVESEPGKGSTFTMAIPIRRL